MNPFTRGRDSADEQAALWAARLHDSDLAETDRAALDAWLAASPGHRTLLAQYCQLSANLEDQLPALVAAGALSMPAKGTPAGLRNGSRRRAAFAVLAAAAAVAAGVWLAWPGVRSPAIATAAGERRSLTLADGTRLELNARTEVRIESTRTERRVRLTEGEAYFVVTKDHARPFTVETPAGSVRVTGTVFDVSAGGAAELDVTVVEGSVQVRPAGADRPAQPSDFVLGARDRLSLRAEGATVRPLSGGDLDDALAWRHGRIVFHGVPLREALAAFSRYHGRGLVATAGAANLRIGGVFSLDDLDGFFTALEEVLPVRVARDPDGGARVCLRREP